MAMAYGALANGGRLMQPRLVREIRNSDGTVLERFEPRVIRQVISPRVASSVSRVLEDVVEDGTGKSARLGSFRVAGKSGTSRLYSADVGYEAGAYFSSFVGYFPAEAPQLVVFVKLDRPQGAYYGGAVAAPVTRATMEAALAARATPLDRAALLNATRVSTTPVARPAALFASVPITAPVSSAKGMAFPVGLPTDESPRLGSVVPIPDVSGLPSRVAVRRLHALGLRVSLARPGEILGTEPAAGTRVLRGDTIRLKVRRRIDD